MVRAIGDRVLVVADNYGSAAVIIEMRDSEGAPPSQYKVKTDSGDSFWAFDFEIHDHAMPTTTTTADGADAATILIAEIAREVKQIADALAAMRDLAARLDALERRVGALEEDYHAD